MCKNKIENEKYRKKKNIVSPHMEALTFITLFMAWLLYCLLLGVFFVFFFLFCHFHSYTYIQTQTNNFYIAVSSYIPTYLQSFEFLQEIWNFCCCCVLYISSLVVKAILPTLKECLLECVHKYKRVISLFQFSNTHSHTHKNINKNQPALSLI